MKKLKYKFLQSVSDDGTPVFSEKTLDFNDANVTIAKAEAYNGEYAVEEDGSGETPAVPTVSERVEALELAMLEMMGVSLL